jgi:predicted ester cyclase
MSADTNRAIVKRFVDEWLNSRDRSALDQICVPGMAFHWGALGDGRGVEALAELEEKVRAAFPDILVEPAFTVADDTYVVNRSLVTGTHLGTWFGVEPTGKACAWTAVEIYRIEDGRLAEQWLNEDWTSVLQELGRVHT